MIAFQMMVAFYFGSKVMHHITSADRTKSTVYSESMYKLREEDEFGEFDELGASG
jgi:hypothetical protein